METELERMVVRLMGDGSSYDSMLASAQSTTASVTRQIEGNTKHIEKMGTALTGYGQNVVSTVMGMVGGISLIGSILRSVNLAAEWEKNEVSFGVMLRNTEKGIQMVRDIQTLAASTPLNTRELQTGARILLQYGVEGDRIISTLRTIGDVTGGDAQKMLQMANAFGQMNAAGRLMGQERLQMINAGFNPIQEMAENLTKTLGGNVQQHMASLMSLMERGGISSAMVAESFKRATSEGGQFFGMMDKQSKTIGGLFSTMQDDIEAFLRQIGFGIVELFQLKTVMQAVSSAAQMLTDALTPIIEWVKSLPAPVKTVLGIIAVLVSSIIAAGAAWVVLGPLITGAVGALSAAFAFVSGMLPVILAVGAALAVVGTAVAAWVDSVGGVGEAWKIVKAHAEAFWNWIKPTVLAVASVLTAVWDKVKAVAVKTWETIRGAVAGFVNWAKPIFLAYVGVISAWWNVLKEVAVKVWEGISFIITEWWGVVRAVFGMVADLVSSVWTSIFGESQLTWNSVKDFIVDALIIVEYALRNAGKVGEYVSAGLALHWVQSFETIKHFFSSTLPTVLNWFGRNTVALFRDVGGFIGEMFVGLAGNVERVFSRITDALVAFLEDPTQGITINTRGMWEPLTAEFRSTMERFPNLSSREIGELERQLRADFTRLGNNLAEDFTAFRERRLREIAEFGMGGLNLGQAAQAGARAGSQFGQNFNNTAGKEMQKFDATLRFGAEALGRINDYLERIRSPGSTSGATLPGGGPAPASGGANLPGPPRPAGLVPEPGAGGARVVVPPAPQVEVRQQNINIPNIPNIPAIRVQMTIDPPQIPRIAVPPVNVQTVLQQPNPLVPRPTVADVAIQTVLLPPDPVMNIRIAPVRIQTQLQQPLPLDPPPMVPRVDIPTSLLRPEPLPPIVVDPVNIRAVLIPPANLPDVQVRAVIANINQLAQQLPLLNATGNLNFTFNVDLREAQQRIATAVEQMSEQVTRSLAEINRSFNEASQRLNATFDQISTTVREIGDNTSEAIRLNSDQLSRSISEVGDELVASLRSIRTQINSSLDRLGNSLSASVTAVGDQLSDSIRRVSDRLDQALRDIGDQIVSSLQHVTDQFNLSIAEISNEINRSISRTSETVSQSIRELTGRLDQSITRLTDQAVLSMQQITNHISGVIGDVGNQIVQAVAQMPTEMRGLVLDIVDRLIAALERLIDRATAAIERSVNRVITAISNIADRLLAMVTSAPARAAVQVGAAADRVVGNLLDRLAPPQVEPAGVGFQAGGILDIVRGVAALAGNIPEGQVANAQVQWDCCDRLLEVMIANNNGRPDVAGLGNMVVEALDRHMDDKTEVKELVKISRSMDKHLDAIERKPATVIHVAGFRG